MTNDDTKVKIHYDQMRKLNPGLPEWEDASNEVKDLHRETYANLIEPIIEEMNNVIKRGKVRNPRN